MCFFKYRLQKQPKAQSSAVPMCPSCVALHGLWCWDRWVPSVETPKHRNSDTDFPVNFPVDFRLSELALVLWCAQALIPTRAIRCKNAKKMLWYTVLPGPQFFFASSIGFKIGSFDILCSSRDLCANSVKSGMLLTLTLPTCRLLSVFCLHESLSMSKKNLSNPQLLYEFIGSKIRMVPCGRPDTPCAQTTRLRVNSGVS